MRVGRGCFGEQLATEEAPEFFVGAWSRFDGVPIQPLIVVFFSTISLESR